MEFLDPKTNPTFNAEHFGHPDEVEALFANSKKNQF
jgi:hypothetical protein